MRVSFKVQEQDLVDTFLTKLQNITVTPQKIPGVNQILFSLYDSEHFVKCKNNC